jgi:glycosyltransferase involved in cell wall biosynthesis
MACGCCPVASNVGGLPELVCDPGHGILFESGNIDELADALVCLVRNVNERMRLAANASSFVRQNFTIQQACRRLAEIYRNLLFRSGTRCDRGELRASSEASAEVASSMHV